MISESCLVRALGRLQLPPGEMSRFQEALGRRAPVGIRRRPGWPVNDLPFGGFGVNWHPGALALAAGIRPGGYPHYGAGAYYIQDPGSLLALSLFHPRPNGRYCDLCAAPGGKSTALLESLGDEGWLFVNEAVHSRLPPLVLNLARHGSTRFVLAQQDPDRLANELAEAFDGVLVDAPCSGQSLYAKGKQTEASFSTRQIEHSAARQQRILTAAAQLVSPGGELVYSTCTFSDLENELQMENFLAAHPEWSLETIPELAPYESPLLPGCYRLWPHRDPCAGGFAALLRRNDAGAPGRIAESRSPSWRRRNAPAWQEVSLPDEFTEWGELSVAHVWQRDEQIVAWPDDPPRDWLPLACGGPEVAYFSSTRWLPSYGLAMRRDECWHPRQSWELPEHDAARYLGGESLPTTLHGWSIARYAGEPLGWAKGDGRLGKNHLPKAARLTIAARTSLRHE